MSIFSQELIMQHLRLILRMKLAAQVATPNEHSLPRTNYAAPKANIKNETCCSSGLLYLALLPSPLFLR